MRDLDGILEREDEALGEAAEMDLALAKHVFTMARAAEDVGEVERLVRAYQRVTRSLRQTLALRQRLRRERQADRTARDAYPPPAEVRAHPALIEARKTQVRAAVERLIYTEHEHETETAEMMCEDLDEVLDDFGRAKGFATAPLVEVVRHACEVLELDPDDATLQRILDDLDPAQADARQPALEDTA